MAAGPIGSCWAPGTWPDTTWEENTWSGAVVTRPPVGSARPRFTFDDLRPQSQIVRGEILAEAAPALVEAVARERLDALGRVLVEALAPVVELAVVSRMPDTTVAVMSASPEVQMRAGVWVRAETRQEQEALWLLGVSE